MKAPAYHRLSESPYRIGGGTAPGGTSEAAQRGREINPLLRHFHVYLAHDCTVHIPDVHTLCTSEVIHSSPSTAAHASFVSPFSVSTSHAWSSPVLNLIDDHATCQGNSTCGQSRRDMPSAAAADNSPRPPVVSGQPPPPSPPPSVEQPQWTGSLVLLVPVRLGGGFVNPIYTTCLKAILSHPLCLGVIGGRPGHSLYFIGYQGDRLIYLDPHYCQPAVDVTAMDFPLESFHCPSPRHMHFNRMDPSCTLGFYCRNRLEFDHFQQTIGPMVLPAASKHSNYPLFSFSNQSRLETFESHDHRLTMCASSPSLSRTVRSRTVSSQDSSDDFVLL